MNEYSEFKEHIFNSQMEMVRGNPEATPNSLFAAVDAENPPLRLSLGSHNLSWVKGAYAERMAEWEAWEDVAIAAQG
jgi:hypothetical protein